MISVVVNVYNGEKYIKKCLDSIINQTFKDLEILIVNDGSTDDTLKICKSYKDKRIRIINQDNIGISLSRNVGIDKSKGEYLFFVDSDDYIAPDTIEYLYKTLKKYKVEMATCRSIDVYDYNDIEVSNGKDRIDIIDGLEYVKRILFSIDRNGNIWGKLMTRNLIQKIRFENRIISDVAVIHKMTIDLDKIAYSNQIKYYYLKHRDSILGKKSIFHSNDLFDASLERYNYIKEKYPDFVENDIGILLMIVTLYLHNKKGINNHLKEKNAFVLYNKLFSFSKLKYIESKKDKLKLILFRINPKICYLLSKKYLIIKKLLN